MSTIYVIEKTYVMSPIYEVVSKGFWTRSVVCQQVATHGTCAVRADSDLHVSVCEVTYQDPEQIIKGPQHAYGKQHPD